MESLLELWPKLLGDDYRSESAGQLWPLMSFIGRWHNCLRGGWEGGCCLLNLKHGYGQTVIIFLVIPNEFGTPLWSQTKAGGLALERLTLSKFVNNFGERFHFGKTQNFSLEQFREYHDSRIWLYL